MFVEVKKTFFSFASYERAGCVKDTYPRGVRYEKNEYEVRFPRKPIGWSRTNRKSISGEDSFPEVVSGGEHESYADFCRIN